MKLVQKYINISFSSIAPAFKPGFIKSYIKSYIINALAKNIINLAKASLLIFIPRLKSRGYLISYLRAITLERGKRDVSVLEFRI